MAEPADITIRTMAHLFQLHQRLIAQAADELLTAFEAISDSVGEVLEDDSLGEHAVRLTDAVVRLQAADSVAQRLEHVESGLAMLEAELVPAVGAVDPAVVDELLERTAKLFTIADERAIYTNVFDGDVPIEAIAANLDDPDLFLFDSPGS